MQSFAKSFGPGRNPTIRPTARSKSQAAPRPKTSNGHRDEDTFDQTTATNGTIRPLLVPISAVSAIFHCPTDWTARFPSQGDSQSITDSFIVWDVDGRVIDMESQFNELKDMVNSSLTQKKGRDDALELAKTRGTSHHECCLHVANCRSGRTRKRSKNSC